MALEYNSNVIVPLGGISGQSFVINASDGSASFANGNATISNAGNIECEGSIIGYINQADDGAGNSLTNQMAYFGGDGIGYGNMALIDGNDGTAFFVGGAVSLNAGGSASFLDGSLNFNTNAYNQDPIDLNSDGSASFLNGLVSFVNGSWDSAGGNLGIGNDGSIGASFTSAWEINADGSALFADGEIYLTTEGGPSSAYTGHTYNLILGSDGSIANGFGAWNINSDGSASFGYGAAGIDNSGNIECNSLNIDGNSLINSDGSASFADGAVTISNTGVIKQNGSPFSPVASGVFMGVTGTGGTKTVLTYTVPAWSSGSHTYQIRAWLNITSYSAPCSLEYQWTDDSGTARTFYMKSCDSNNTTWTYNFTTQTFWAMVPQEFHPQASSTITVTLNTSNTNVVNVGAAIYDSGY